MAGKKGTKAARKAKMARVRAGKHGGGGGGGYKARIHVHGHHVREHWKKHPHSVIARKGYTYHPTSGKGFGVHF